jgi:nucleoside-diphosphate-sugar epimerase
MRPDFYRGRRVLVTGADGFIGAYLCRRLTAHGAQLFAMRRVEHGDLSEADVAERVFADFQPEIVFHLASLALDGRSLDLVIPVTLANLVAAVRLLTAAAAASSRGTPRVVLAGSMKEPEGDEVPTSVYAVAKGSQSAYARMFHAVHGLDAVVARMFMVYGPDERNRERLLPYVTRSLLRGEPARLTSGRRESDWIYIDDAVEGLMVLGATDGLGGSRIDIGSGSLASVRTLVEEVARLTGSPSELLFGAVPDRGPEPLRVADVEETYRRTGWRAVVPLEEGLRRTVAWYRDELERGER